MRKTGRLFGRDSVGFSSTRRRLFASRGGGGNGSPSPNSGGPSGPCKPGRWGGPGARGGGLEFSRWGGIADCAFSRTLAGSGNGKGPASGGFNTAALTFFASPSDLISSFHCRTGNSAIRAAAASPNAPSLSPADPLSSESNPSPSCQRTKMKNASPRMTR